METRIGFVGIVVQRMESAPDVNRVLSLFGDMIRGRIGIPSRTEHTAVIGVIVEGDNSRIGAMTGKLGNIPGITVKSAIAPAETKKQANGIADIG